MNKGKIILVMIVLICILSGISTGCEQQLVDNTTPANITESVANTESIATSDTSISDISEMEATISKSDTTSEAAEAEPEYSADSFYEIDINCDKITEDFFIDDTGYKIVMYSDESKTEAFDEIKIPRTDKIDIYRKNISQPNEQSDYIYYFSYMQGLDRSILFSLICTGSDDYRSFNGLYYCKMLAPNISYGVANSTILKQEFDYLICNPNIFLREQFELEYVDTIDLEERINSDCVQSLKKSISVSDSVPEIQIYTLENDVFKKKFRLTNGKHSFFTADFNAIELYERYADIRVPTNVYKDFDIVKSDEKEYLICLKNQSENTEELIYLGTAEECFLFPYEFYLVNSSYRELLKNDGWNYCNQINF